MIMSRCIQAQSIILIFLTLAKHITTKPAGTDTHGRDDVDTITPSEEYEYDWTSDSSGSLDYSDVDMFTPRYCPVFCTCVVETILYCSRQGITSIGNRQEYHDLDIKILDGPLPKTAASVHLGYNNLTTLPSRLFEDTAEIGRNKIMDLYLQSNQISSVHPDAFIVLKSLRNMDLSNNRIANLVQGCDEASTTDLNASCVPGRTEDNFLRSAPRSLVSLNLNGNLIRGIPNYSFISLSNLEVLRLSWNQITWISRKGFYGLHKLRVLQLRGNPLGVKTALKLGDILQHFITGDLLMKQNDSSDLDSVKFYPDEIALPNAERSVKSARSRQTPRNGGYDKISLDTLEDLDLGATNISRFPDVLPPSVKRLYLDLNRISTIPRRVLEPVKSLEHLQLGGNRIEHFSDDTFSSMPSIRVLDLSRNNLTKLTPNSFTGLLGLISLRLYGNRQLSELPRKVFWSLPMLRILYLHDCNLSNLPSGPWIFRILALWLYGNPIDCNCQNLLSLKVRIYRPRHPSLDLRLDPYRSVLWDDADTWKYQRRVKTACATPSHFRGQKLKDIQMSDMLCTYQDHYETAVSRQISWSRFLSSDYQQDESTEVHNSDPGMVEEPVMDYTYDSSESDYASKLEKEINLSKEKSLIKETRSETEMSKKKVVVPELVYLDATGDPLNSIGLQADGKPQKESTALASRIASLKETADVRALPEENDLLSDDSVETEWVISLPGNAEIDQNDQEKIIEVRKNLDESNVSYDYNVNPTPPLANSAKEKYGPYDLEIEIGQQLDAKPEIAIQPRHETTAKEQRVLYGPLDHQERIWKEHPQGFAEYPMYDDGEAELDMISILRFTGEMDNTLSESDLLRLRTEMRNINAWRSYQEYYSDVESSGDEYGESLMFAMHGNDLKEAGATEEELLADLSQIYNSSDRFEDYGESYLTVDISTSDDKEF